MNSFQISVVQARVLRACWKYANQKRYEQTLRFESRSVSWQPRAVEDLDAVFQRCSTRKQVIHPCSERSDSGGFLASLEPAQPSVSPPLGVGVGSAICELHQPDRMVILRRLRVRHVCLAQFTTRGRLSNRGRRKAGDARQVGGGKSSRPDYTHDAKGHGSDGSLAGLLPAKGRRIELPWKMLRDAPPRMVPLLAGQKASASRSRNPCLSVQLLLRLLKQRGEQALREERLRLGRQAGFVHRWCSDRPRSHSPQSGGEQSEHHPLPFFSPPVPKEHAPALQL
jgi:hypothetical protein